MSRTVPTTTLYRLSGVSLVLGCVLLIVGDIIRIGAGTDPASTLLASGWFLQGIGSVLAALGLPGLYARYAAAVGVLGLVGVVGIAMFLFLFGIFGCLVHALVLPVLAKQPSGVPPRPVGVDMAFITGVIFVVVGCLCMGIATIRAHVLPRGVGALLIVGGVTLFVGHPITHLEDVGLASLMIGLGWAGLSLIPRFTPDEAVVRATSDRYRAVRR